MIVSVLLIAAAIPVVAVGVEAVLLRRDKRGRPPLGKLVDVGCLLYTSDAADE